MICNVCGEDKRCYELSETPPSPGPQALRFLGMRFRICADCLKKQISSIATDKTTIEKPEDFPVPGFWGVRTDKEEKRRVAVTKSLADAEKKKKKNDH
jgi:hypothetical protein